MRIGILNYGLGNIGSIKNILKKIGHDSIMVSNPEDFLTINALILPGVGSFDYGMESLNNSKLLNALNNHALVEKKLTIGICLGMQLMFKSSEEGNLPGLGWIDEHLYKFKFEKNFPKIPHMGWNYVNSSHEIYNFSIEEKRYYFVHSYYAPLNDKYTLSKSLYGTQEFSSSIKKNNIFGFQFHPEKSHKYGLKLLENLFQKI
jgi:glutamine amidotransferase